MESILWGNLLSLIGSIIMILMGLIKGKNKFIFAQCIMNLFYCAGNIFLGGISGAIANAVTMLRNIVCLKWQLGLPIRLFFIALLALVGLFFGCTGIMWLPIIANCMFTLMMATENIILLKVSLIVSQLLWVVYDYCVLNYVTVPFDVAAIVTNAIVIIEVLLTEKVK